ncbi:hypothetical protein L195_g006699 [Trifolium pratense]|uniref:Transposase (putative) gypsy type domain-containing protein n=1 Tax=Trifolium pratense TaxID=57577 RepID=A0A2K3P4D2_TRIPR|nr:hypothetical protein L195_g006699 [Trifolium pratense]
MEGSQRENRPVVDYSWVADEPRTTISLYSDCADDIPDSMCTDIQIPPTQDFEVRIPTSRRRICSVWSWGTIPMYEIAFKHLGFKLPFSDLEVSIFRHLLVAPSQLHPNALAFIRAFELTCDHLGLGPTLPLFFYHFGLQRSCPRGEKAKGKAVKGAEVPDTKGGWVSFRQRERLFDMYEESVRGFKDLYYGVRPITLKGWQNFVRRDYRVDAQGKKMLDDQGQPIEEDFAIFPFYWRSDHYSVPTSEFVFKLKDLTKEERADYKKLETFVKGLPPWLCEDVRGHPTFDGEGRRVTRVKFIETKELVASDSEEKLEAFWNRMTSAAAVLRRAKKNAKKDASSAAGASSALEGTSVQRFPAGSSETQRQKRMRTEDFEDTSSRQQHFIDLDGPPRSPTTGLHKLLPSSAATEFVLPPAFARGPQLDKYIQLKVDPADETIISDMGPTALRAEIASHSTALIKLLEVATVLNGRECKYLEERDNARSDLKLLEQKLKDSESASEEQLKILSSNLEKAEEKLKISSGEKDAALKEAEELRAKIVELEGKLKEHVDVVAVEEGEKVLDPDGEYTSCTRTALIAKIHELSNNMVAASSFSFQNAVAQLQLLNPGIAIEGLDEDKEVRDGQILTPED